MRAIWSTLWLRKASVSAQMANETNLWAEMFWTVRRRNVGGRGWCDWAFSKFPAKLSCSVSSGFADFRSTFDNFAQLASVLRQVFQAIRGNTERFQCIFEALFLASFGTLAQRQFAVEQFFQEAVIFHADNMTGSKRIWLHQDGVDSGKSSPS